MRARYYNTDIKRFINRDTVSGDLTNSQSLNRYAYVQGNPINQTDPFGLYPIGDVLNILSQAGHMLLDTAGLFWDGFDLINAAWYQAEGNELMAMTSAVSAIPFMGSVAAGGTKLAFKGSKAAKAASKAADYISNLSKLMGFTGQGTISAIDAGYAFQDYISAIENGTATDADMQDVILNALFTVANTVCAVSLAAKMTTRVKANGVGAKVKESAGEVMSSNNKGYASGKSMSEMAMSEMAMSGKGGKKELETLLLPSPKGTNPWMEGTEILSVEAPKNCYINMALADGQYKPGGWGTFDNIPNVEYVRNSLAVTPEFKSQVSYVQKYLVPEGTRIQIGTVGPQVYNNIIYPGGGNQVQILNFADRANLIPIGEKIRIY